MTDQSKCSEIYNRFALGADAPEWQAGSQAGQCLKILKEEIARGRSLLGLIDTAGKPVFDDKLTQACIEALQYCAERIRKEVR